MYCGLQTSRRLFGSGGPKGQAVPETDGIPCSSRLPARARNASGSPVLQNNSHNPVSSTASPPVLLSVIRLAGFPCGYDREMLVYFFIPVIAGHLSVTPCGIRNFGAQKDCPATLSHEASAFAGICFEFGPGEETPPGPRFFLRKNASARESAARIRRKENWLVRYCFSVTLCGIRNSGLLKDYLSNFL